MATVLQTEYLTLRPFASGDGEAYFAYMSLPEVTRFNSTEPITREQSVEQIEGMVRREQEKFAEQPTNAFVIELRVEGKMIRNCRVAGAGQKPGEADIVYFLHPHYWGRGYATEAVRALIRHGFAAFPLKRIYGTCAIENLASARVMEKAGMSEEEQVFLYAKDGNWVHDRFCDTVSRQFAIYSPEESEQSKLDSRTRASS